MMTINAAILAGTLLLPLGTKVKAPGKAQVTTTQVRFAITRPMLDKINATKVHANHLDKSLLKCKADNQALRNPKSNFPYYVLTFAAGVLTAVAVTR